MPRLKKTFIDPDEDAKSEPDKRIAHEEKKSKNFGFVFVLIVIVIVFGLFIWQSASQQLKKDAEISKLRMELESQISELTGKLSTLEGQAKDKASGEISKISDEIQKLSEELWYAKFILALNEALGISEAQKMPGESNRYVYVTEKKGTFSLWLYDAEKDAQYAQSKAFDILGAQKRLYQKKVSSGNVLAVYEVTDKSIVFLEKDPVDTLKDCESFLLTYEKDLKTITLTKDLLNAGSLISDEHYVLSADRAAAEKEKVTLCEAQKSEAQKSKANN
ncbi:MAG: hypothetical protein HY453_00660 [Parcubacteria group bacterium]|nr:hypothetical protein [Parcubacteria group bacterium]